MVPNADPLKAAKEAFHQTVCLKLRQFYGVLPKGCNSELTGDFVEALVRGFIQDWISPCVLANGTMIPFDANRNLSLDALRPKQIDGIVYDPRMGPPVIREGDFLVAHPLFCRGVIEIKASEADLAGFQQRLWAHYRQYFEPLGADHRLANDVMGIVIADPNPRAKSRASPPGRYLYDARGSMHCPVFILFQNVDGEFSPYEPAIDSLMKAIFMSGWQHPSRDVVLSPNLLPP
jgi:hypothetical protein